MLNACLPCGRQYDVSHLKPGERVQCECGATFEVEFRKPHSPRALQCSSCGANLREGSSKCEYCAAEVTLEERRLSAVCPGCFARASTEARFCMECGLKIQPQALTALAEGTVCPRCEGALRSRDVGPAVLVECAGCGGMWLGEQHFDRLCEDADAADVVSRGIERAEPGVAGDTEEVRYLKCIVCSDFMQRRNYASASGVIIDVCRRHGVWLDHRELERILAFVREGGLDRARERQIERLKSRELRARHAEIHTPMMETYHGRGLPGQDDTLLWALLRLFGFRG
jgi:Zn-finger nucleic acid-binding protein